jgi:hypothetical protein
MDNLRWIYYVERPLNREPDQWFTVVRAETPEGAGEVVRILLAQHDGEITLVRVRAIQVMQ